MNKRIADDVVARLTAYLEATGRGVTHISQVGGCALDWDSSSHAWPADFEPSEEALCYVSECLIKEPPRGTRDASVVAAAHAAFSSEPTLESLTRLAHALEGIDWRAGAG